MKDREKKAKSPWMRLFVIPKKAKSIDLYKGEIGKSMQTQKKRSLIKSIKE